MLMLIGATKIDRVVAVLAGIMQPHAAAAAATNSNALQQRVALARHPMAVRIVVIEIVREPPLVRHELLPIDISRKCVLQANWPILNIATASVAPCREPERRPIGVRRR